MRSDLERHATRSAESEQARRHLADALAKAQADAEAAEGRYKTKCKELSMTKLAKPSGIGVPSTATVGPEVSVVDCSMNMKCQPLLRFCGVCVTLCCDSALVYRRWHWCTKAEAGSGCHDIGA